MKWIHFLVRFLVGLLFIFSGLIKANDPQGLSYKIQEFLEIWDLHSFNSFTLPIAVFLNTAEIGLGVALLVNFKTKATHFLLLLLLFFFTALTGYTYLTGYPKNCGCFGDCLLLSAGQSFLKDVVLLVMLIFLHYFSELNTIGTSVRYAGFNCLVSIIAGIGLQYHTLNHLPIIDCLPYKIGADLSINRKIPATAIPDSTVVYFTYEKNNQLVQFSATEFPADFSPQDYQFVKREDKLIRPGKDMDPPIKGFVLSGETGIDSTEHILQLPAVVLVLADKAAAVQKSLKVLDLLPQTKTGFNKIPVYVVTAEPTTVRELLSQTKFNGWPVFSCDLKAIQTAARTNPTIYYLEKGVVIKKKAAIDYNESNY
ncbi:MAG: DoxX family protein [Bacteroidetes bacterium]|nr:DoxX family protein [Bacteroidota bacterium]